MNKPCFGSTTPHARADCTAARANWRQWLRRVVTLATLQVSIACAAVPAAPVQLSWEPVRIDIGGPKQARSEAAFVLTNHDEKPLPAHGWSIYFSCLSEVETGAMRGHIAIERVNGSLFRLHPTAGFAALAPGESVRVTLFHPTRLLNVDKVPVGAYFVRDDDAQTGHPIDDYRVTLPALATQIDGKATAQSPPATAEEIFARNRIIADVAEADLAPVFPTPRRMSRGSATLTWSTSPQVQADAGLDAEMAFAQALLARYFAPANDAGKAQAARGAVLALHVGKVAGEDAPEAYELSVDAAKGVRITGNTAAGVARGLQSLHDLLPLRARRGDALSLAAIDIVDAPRFAYRGLMFDVSRNFQDKRTILRLLDLMARYKLNVFHFHLTDDEGWRLEIPDLPELTSFGARRGHTLDESEHLFPAYGSGPSLADPHGSGYYTRADYIDILKYAAARHIEVIPEIEMPGHARAAIKAMAHRARRLAQTGATDADAYLLTDARDHSVYVSAQGYHDNVMDPGLDSTYAFIEEVVAAVATMHRDAGVPLTTLHVGGDEVPKGAWEKSPAVRELMRRERLKSISEIWDYFYTRVDGILHAHALAATGWAELGTRQIMQHGKAHAVPNPAMLADGFTLLAWSNLDKDADLGYRLANAGYDVILAPATALYLDMAHSRNPTEPGMNWAAYADLDNSYDYIPLDAVRKSPTDAARIPDMQSLTETGARHIRGVEAALWGETLRDPARIDYLLMPRLLAVAELGWASDPAWTRERDPARAAQAHAAAWSAFVNQIGKRVLPRLDAEQAGIGYRIPAPGLHRDGERVLVNMQIPGFTLRYRDDGGEPDANSPVVDGSLPARGKLRVAAFDGAGRKGLTSPLDLP